MEGLIFIIEGIDDTTPEEIAKESVTDDPLFELKIVGILRDYLQPDSKSPLTQAAHSLVRLLPDPPEPRGWTNELSTLWELCISVGKQIQYSHPSMMKLVRLVLELRRSPKTAFVGFWDEEKRLRRYNFEPNLLGETLRENYDPPFSVDEPEETSTPEFARRWINLNAFWALLHQLGGADLEQFCLWTMQDAFQTSSSVPTSSHDEPAVSCRVAAAAQWVLKSGQTLFIRAHFPTTNTDMETGEHLDPNHWRYWRKMFRDAAEKKDGIDSESRGLALKAADLMDALEKSMLGT